MVGFIRRTMALISMEWRLCCCASCDHSLNPLAELHAPQKILVTRVRSQRGEQRFNLKVDHLGRMIVVSFLEPGKGFVLFAQTDVDQGDVIGRDVLPLCSLLQLCKCGECLRLLP